MADLSYCPASRYHKAGKCVCLELHMNFCEGCPVNAGLEDPEPLQGGEMEAITNTCEVQQKFFEES